MIGGDKTVEAHLKGKCDGCFFRIGYNICRDFLSRVEVHHALPAGEMSQQGSGEYQQQCAVKGDETPTTHPAPYHPANCRGRQDGPKGSKPPGTIDIGFGIVSAMIFFYHGGRAHDDQEGNITGDKCFFEHDVKKR